MAWAKKPARASGVATLIGATTRAEAPPIPDCQDGEATDCPMEEWNGNTGDREWDKKQRGSRRRHVDREHRREPRQYDM